MIRVKILFKVRFDLSTYFLAACLTDLRIENIGDFSSGFGPQLMQWCILFSYQWNTIAMAMLDAGIPVVSGSSINTIRYCEHLEMLIP